MRYFLAGIIAGSIFGMIAGLQVGKMAVMDLRDTSVDEIHRLQAAGEALATSNQKVGFAIGRMVMAECMRSMVRDHIENDEHCSADFANFPKWEAELK